ncbi:MAG: ribonuclease P protein component [Deltaproteobacteria bacterium]|nr:ribonuclease P protein component [Deltaproteobacteria bacterium]MBI3079236.1 ribonuclease P protein component [Deltaproteobacteria bacterium]
MKQHGLPRQERVGQQQEFLRIRRRGTRAETAHFVVIFCPNRRPYSRLGLSVGKKVGPAVQRNRLKRLLREFFRLNKVGLPLSQDILIMAKPEARDLRDYAAVVRELSRFLARSAGAAP